MAASNTRFTQNSLGQSKTPIDSDHGIYRDLRNVDYSRLSCGVGDTHLGRRPGSQPPLIT
jgi:hypothetical protein